MKITLRYTYTSSLILTKERSMSQSANNTLHQIPVSQRFWFYTKATEYRIMNRSTVEFESIHVALVNQSIGHTTIKAKRIIFVFNNIGLYYKVMLYYFYICCLESNSKPGPLSSSAAVEISFSFDGSSKDPIAIAINVIVHFVS